MPHASRAVVVRYPHLVGLRARPGRRLFAKLDDGLRYLLYLRRECRRRRVRVLAWWLGRKRIYLVLLPATKAGMAGALGEAHRQYARRINAEAGARGRLFEPHYDSCVVSWEKLPDAARFAELGGKAEEKPRPWRYLWCSAAFNCRHRRLDPLLARRELPKMVADWREWLCLPGLAAELKAIGKVLRAGRALGDRRFAARMSRTTRKQLRKHKPGPKIKPEPPCFERPYRQYDEY